MSTPSREEALFSDALAQPAAERATFLARRCGDDVAMLARIAALIAAHEAGPSLLGSNRPAAIAAAAAHEEKPGDIISHYRLLQKLGEGGCGVVWMAEQEEPVRRRVALKIIKLGMDTKAVVARFEAERQALAMMDHPNIAKVHDAGATETGRPFFVMELVRGIPITKYCDENHLTPTDRLELFIKVCQAVQHAHQKGIIHRDLKPSNILVTVNDGAPTPKVIDFGIAKATQGKLTDATVFTAFEQFIGTPVYMSPEQAEMSSLDIDTRSDIYSLGVLLYELLTGRPPFDPKKFAEAGVEGIRQQIREVEPPRPSARLSTLDADERTTIAKLRGTAASQLSIILRGDLDWIVMRCIEKDRTRRYDTANGLAMDIQRYLRNEPVVARPPSTAYLLQKLIRRHRVGFAAATLVAATLAIGVVVSSWQAFRARQAELRAESSRAAEENLRRAAQSHELKARRQAYAADMNLVQQALANDDLIRAQQLLDRHRPQRGERDLRGWEWRYLWQSCRPAPHSVLCRKPHQISSLSISADGNWLAVGEFIGGGVSVRHLRSGHEHNLTAGVMRAEAAFSPAKPLLAITGAGPSGGADGARGFMFLWNLGTQQIERRVDLDGEWGSIIWTSLHFSADGRSLVTSSFAPNNALTWWRMPQLERSREFRVPQPLPGFLADSFAVSRDFRRAAHRTRAENELRVIDLATGAEQWKARGADELVAAMAFSPDGTILASGAAYSESTIRLWDAATGREIGRLDGHRGWVSALLFFPDGRTLASASGDQTIRLWDVRGRRLLRTFHGHEREVLRLALHPDNVTLISGGRDGTVRVWDTASGHSASAVMTVPATGVVTWRFASNSSVVTVESDGTVAEWRGDGFREKEVLFRISGVAGEERGFTSRNYYMAQFSRDGRALAVGSHFSGVVQIWDVERRQLRWKLKSQAQTAFPVEFLDNNSRLVVFDRSSFGYREFDLASGDEIAAWSGPPLTWQVSSSAVSPDEKLVLMIGQDGTALLRNRRTGGIARFDLAIRWADGPKFSSDGRFFATGTQLVSPKVWETESCREVAELTGSVEVNSVAFSPEGSRIAAGSSGLNAMTLWETGSYQRVLTLPADGSLFRRAAFSPDGNIVGARSLGGVLYLWRAPTWEEIEVAEKTRTKSGKP